jgi:chorismate mutase
MAIRAIRGAIQLDVDEREHLLKSTAELLTKVLHANNLDNSALISILFTATPDITSEFPAVGARELGLGDVPLMCFVEMNVKNALPRVVRIMVYAEMSQPRKYPFFTSFTINTLNVPIPLPISNTLEVDFKPNFFNLLRINRCLGVIPYFLCRST